MESSDKWTREFSGAMRDMGATPLGKFYLHDTTYGKKPGPLVLFGLGLLAGVFGPKGTLANDSTNQAPVVNAGPSVTISEGSWFNGLGHVDDTGSYSWSGTADYGDGTGLDPLYIDNLGNFTLNHYYNDDGPYVVQIDVADDTSAAGATSVAVTVINAAPEVLVGPDATIDEGGTFYAGGSFSDPGADTWTATVDYGDGTGAQPLTLNQTYFDISHTYADNGNYIVTVTVTDDDGGVGTGTMAVAVRNANPIVDAGAWGFITEGEIFSTVGSITDIGIDTFTATVDYGDGTSLEAIAVSGNTMNLSHLYADNGTFTVTVTVTDDDGGVGTDTSIVTVQNIDPIINLGPDATTINGVFTRSGAFTDPGSDIFTAIVDYGDGAGSQLLPLSGQSFTLNHTYPNDGTYSIVVMVTDDDGGVGVDVIKLNAGSPPVVDAGPDVTVDEGAIFTSTGSFTDPNQEVWVATVDYGDGNGPSPLPLNPDQTFSLSYTYTTVGTYTVMVTVDDQVVGSDSDTMTVAVRDVAPTLTFNPSGNYPLGTTTLIFQGTDPSGNQSMCTTDVTVVDTAAPSLTCPAVHFIEADEQCLGQGAAPLTISEVCDPSPQTTTTPDLTSWPLGDTDITHTVTDAAGNRASCAGTVRVVDLMEPSIACNVEDIDLPTATLPVSFTATATDNCGTPTVSISSLDCWADDGNGGRINKTNRCVVNPVGDTMTISTPGDSGDTIEWTVVAIDSNGNTASTQCVVRVLSSCPSTINGDFATSVPSNASGGGWETYANDGAGGWRNENSNSYFIINAAGQGSFDPYIQQRIQGLTPGLTYTISGDFTNRYGCCGSTSALSFGVELDRDNDGVMDELLLERQNPGARYPTFHPFSTTFVASASSHTIRFTSERNGDDTEYAIDNIAIDCGNLVLPSECISGTFEGSDYIICRGGAAGRTRSQARTWCQGYGMDLADIDSGAENTWITDTTLDAFGYTNFTDTSYWIGINDIPNEGTWVTVDGATEVAPRFTRGEPNGGRGENCVHLLRYRSQPYGWNDAGCESWRWGWACESP